MKIRNKILIILGVLIIVGAIIYMYGSCIEAKNIRIKEYKIGNELIDMSYDGFTIIQISDIHYGTSIQEKELNKIVENINKIKPDLVFLTGDLVDADISRSTHNELAQILKSIKASIGKYAINGNHDTYYNDWEKLIRDSDFTNINDNYQKIYANSEKAILIAGISDNINSIESINGKMKRIDEQLSNDNNEDIIFKILLMHEPDYVDEINVDKFDVILSGHSHGGQVRLPFIGATYRPIGCKKYYDEYYILNKTELYISNGLGTTWIPIRFLNNPSFNVFRLTKKQPE